MKNFTFEVGEDKTKIRFITPVPKPEDIVEDATLEGLEKAVSNLKIVKEKYENQLKKVNNDFGGLIKDIDEQIEITEAKLKIAIEQGIVKPAPAPTDTDGGVASPFVQPVN